MDLNAIIIEPITTEKSTMLSDKAKYVFKVNPWATKVDVKNAIKEIYGVEVEKVTMTTIVHKTRMIGRNTIEKRNCGKKALVTIKGKKTIDVSKFKDTTKKESTKKKK